MSRAFNILSLFKISAVIVLVLIALISIFVLGNTQAQVQKFSLHSGNVGIGGSGPADTTPPSVVITNPLNGSTVSGIVSYTANASDDVAVTNVEFYADQGLVGTDNSAPYSTLWDTTIYAHNTTHSLVTLAFDAAGNIGTSQSYSVTVLDITAPSVSITNPLDGAIVPRATTITITANASDVSGIQKVEFRVNNVLKCTDTLAPYSCNWNVPRQKNKPYAIEAKAFDNVPLTATHTINVTSSN